MSDSFDCLACGRCCTGQRDYVQVFPSDAERLGPVEAARVVAPSTRQIPATTGRPAEPVRFMRMVNGHCSALEVTPGRYACSVYETRPTLCRALEPGSSSCLEARARPLPGA